LDPCFGTNKELKGKTLNNSQITLPPKEWKEFNGLTKGPQIGNQGKLPKKLSQE